MLGSYPVAGLPTPPFMGRRWLVDFLTGAADLRSPGSGMRVPRGRTTAEVLHDYRAAVAAGDAAIRAIGDPDAHLARLVSGKRMTMRWLIVHMTSETARHAGHADILREQIDGTTGPVAAAAVANLARNECPPALMSVYPGKIQRAASPPTRHLGR